MRLLGQFQTLHFFLFFLQKDFARTKSTKSTKNTKSTKSTKSTKRHKDATTQKHKTQISEKLTIFPLDAF